MYQFSAEVSKTLQLVIHSLYTNKDIFLRELISNSSDACEKLRYLSLSNSDFAILVSNLGISIEVKKDLGVIVVKDNGIGMSKQEMIDNLGTIAKSGTEEFAKNTQDTSSNNINDLIGKFGVGFYSAFMVAKHIEVKSKKAGENVAHLWSSDGMSGFDVSELTDNMEHGTEISIYLKDEEK